MINKINSFKEEYFFLSNFYGSSLIFDGIVYPSTENAFQAQKCITNSEKYQFCHITPSQAKKLGRKVSIRTDWEAVKCDLMYEIVKQKFMQNPSLLSRLRATGDAYLEEGNYWNDRFWGTMNGIGENNLGKILMRVRKELCE